MSYQNEALISPKWPGFKRIWWIITIILFILLLLLYLLGYAPGGRNCPFSGQHAPATTSNVSSGHSSSVEDKTAPVIKPDDIATLHLQTGSNFSYPSLIAMDDHDGELTVSTIGTVNTQFPGEYELIHSVTDSAGNMTTKTQKIIVERIDDQEAPEITLNAAPLQFLVVGEEYQLSGVTAHDEVDGDVDVNISGSVDTTKPGYYSIIYRARDLAGNVAETSQVVVVEDGPDVQAPTIALNGPAHIIKNVGDEFIDPGASAIDNTGSENIAIHTDGVVDTGNAGNYTLSYKATDKAGNSTTKTRIVTVKEIIDRQPPEISLNEAALRFISVGEEYKDSGATAMDLIDGEVDVVTKGEVNTEKPGQYELTYTATDKAGNSSVEKRKVVVSAVAKEEPVKIASKDIPTTRLYFDKNQFTDPKDKKKTLDNLIKYLKANKKSKVLVSGFHDPSGDKQLNKALAKKRAATVIDLLKKAGISEDRIRQKEPVETTGSGSPPEARRVEIKVIS